MKFKHPWIFRDVYIKNEWDFGKKICWKQANVRPWLKTLLQIMTEFCHILGSKTWMGCSFWDDWKSLRHNLPKSCKIGWHNTNFQRGKFWRRWTNLWHVLGMKTWRTILGRILTKTGLTWMKDDQDLQGFFWISWSKATKLLWWQNSNLANSWWLIETWTDAQLFILSLR